MVHLSNNKLLKILSSFVKPHQNFPLPHNHSHQTNLFDKSYVFDNKLIMFSKNPKSYTNKNTTKITYHKNPQIVERLLTSTISSNTQITQPDKFTHHTISNKKMDLIQTETIIQITQTTTQHNLKINQKKLKNHLSNTIKNIQKTLINITTEYETQLNYPTNKLTIKTNNTLLTQLTKATSVCRTLATTDQTNQILVQKTQITLIKPINTNKSSLFNTLLTKKQTLIHNSPKTTRDVLKITTIINNVTITLLNTTNKQITDDPIKATKLTLTQKLINNINALIIILRTKLKSLSPIKQKILHQTKNQAQIIIYNNINHLKTNPDPTKIIPTNTKTNKKLKSIKSSLLKILINKDLDESTTIITSIHQQNQLLQMTEYLKQTIKTFPLTNITITTEFMTKTITEINILTNKDTQKNILNTMFSQFYIKK